MLDLGGSVIVLLDFFSLNMYLWLVCLWMVLLIWCDFVLLVLLVCCLLWLVVVFGLLLFMVLVDGFRLFGLIVDFGVAIVL